MQTGTTISAIGHVAVIGWAVIGGALFKADPVPPPEVADVSVISSAEFEALSSRAPKPRTDVTSPSLPDADAQPDTPADTDRPRLAMRTEPGTPQPPGTEPDLSDLRAPARTEATTRAPELSDAPETDQLGATLVTPSAPLDRTDRAGRTAARPQVVAPAEMPSPRVDTNPAPKPPSDAEESDQKEVATRPDRSASEQADAKQEKAPDQASSRIVTEADEQISEDAPARTSRPKGRPGDLKDRNRGRAAAIAAALAAAQTESGGALPTNPVPSAPPLSETEKDGLRLAVQKCWVVEPSAESARITVTVALTLTRQGRPDMATLRMLSSSNGSEGAVRAAFDAARRAIARCGNKGFDLPIGKYEQWREVEMTFNPERMRIK